MRLRNWLLAIAVAALMPSVTANAGTITSTISFSATDFVSSHRGEKPPSNPVTGSFTITYDPTLTYSGAGDPMITMNYLNIPVASPIGFDYDPSTQSLTVGGFDSGVNGFSTGVNDFSLDITQLTASSYFSFFFGYSQAGLGTFLAGTMHITVTPGAYVAATPIPATLPLLGTGIAVLVFLGFQRARRDGIAVAA